MFIAGLLVINVFVHRISFSCRILPHSHSRSLSRSLFSFPCTHSARLIPWSWINDDVTFKMATRAKMLNMCLEKRNILDYFFNVAFVLTCRDLEQDDFHACENKWIDVVCVLSASVLRLVVNPKVKTSKRNWWFAFACSKEIHFSSFVMRLCCYR